MDGIAHCASPGTYEAFVRVLFWSQQIRKRVWEVVLLSVNESLRY